MSLRSADVKATNEISKSVEQIGEDFKSLWEININVSSHSACSKEEWIKKSHPKITKESYKSHAGVIKRDL